MSNKKEDVTFQELKDDIFISECYLVGLFWSNPELYIQYNESKIKHTTFGNPVWSFYFYIGQQLIQQNKRDFDIFTVEDYLSRTKKLADNYEEFGGYNTIAEVMEDVKQKQINFEGYYDDVKKYDMLRDLCWKFGKVIITVTGNYNYKIMSSQEIGEYWQKQLNLSLLKCEGKIEDFSLVEGLDEFLVDIDENPTIGMPFHKSPKLTDLCNGWDYGNIYIYSSASGAGKSSYTMEKIILACIMQKEPLLILANEMSISEYRKLLLITVMGNEMYEWMVENGHSQFARKNMDKGNFSVEDKMKLKQAIKIVNELTAGNRNIIKFVSLDDYTMDNVEKTIRHFADQGYRRVIIDTCKPCDGGSASQARWEKFTNDFERLHKLARTNGGGLNLAIWTTLQLADTTINQKFLDETCLAESKKIKNVSSVVFHVRAVFDDEYDTQKRPITVYNFDHSPDAPKGYERKSFKLNKSQEYQYMLLFCSKNRRGMSNNTGADVLVYQVSFNSNRWKEIGWTKIYKEF